VTAAREGHPSRRAFLASAAGFALAGVGTSCTRPASETARTRSDLFVINMLGGIRNPNVPRSGGPSGALESERRTSLDDRAVADALASGTAAVNTTIGYVAGPQEPFDSSVADIARWNRIIRAHPDSLLKVWAAGDIERAARDGRVGIIQGFQNAAMMGDDAGRVAVFAGLGVKIIQLTYNVANQVGHGSMVPETVGLPSSGAKWWPS